jgi:hypothetical protein
MSNGRDHGESEDHPDVAGESETNWWIHALVRQCRARSTI